MSVVVGLVRNGEVYLAADGQCTSGCQKLDVVNCKVFSCGPLEMGFVGTLRVGQVLEVFLKPMLSPKTISDPMMFLVKVVVPGIQEVLRDHGCLYVECGVTKMAGECEGLVALGSRLFRICNDFQVIERRDGFDAVGSGAEVALGALAVLVETESSVEDIVCRAVAIAQRFNVSCGGEITW